MGHAVVHFEIGAPDDAALAGFYQEVFGWSLSDGVDGRLIGTGGGIPGGVRRSPAGQAWAALFVDTDDVQATLDRAVSLGGRSTLEVTELRGGRIAMFTDLDGLPIGLVDAPQAPPAGSGESVDWFEILGADAARTQGFYADLFGWKVDGSGFPGYAVVDTGTGRGIWGGIGGGVDACWALAYAGVSDVEATLRRVEERGGSRLDAPGVTELKKAARTALYGSADDISFGVFRDPAGSLFGAYAK